MGWFSNSCGRCGATINKDRYICGGCEAAIRAKAQRDMKPNHTGHVITAAGVIIAALLQG